MNATLGFLLDDTARLFRREFGARARQHGITALQWRLLMQLRRGGATRQSELADLIEVEPITLSRMVDRLVDAGFIVRRHDPADRRAWQLSLTDRVDELAADVQPLVDDLNLYALSGLDQEEHDRLRRLLSRVRANISGARS